MKFKFLYFCLSLNLIVFGQKSIQITYEQRNYYPADYFDKIPEDLREAARETLIKPTQLYLTNNGDFSLCTNSKTSVSA